MTYLMTLDTTVASFVLESTSTSRPGTGDTTDVSFLLKQTNLWTQIVTERVLRHPSHTYLFFGLFPICFGASSFQSPPSPVLSFFYLYSFLLHVFSYNITPPQFWSSYLHFHLPCSHYYIFFSLSLHVA